MDPLAALCKRSVRRSLDDSDHERVVKGYSTSVIGISERLMHQVVMDCIPVFPRLQNEVKRQCSRQQLE